MTVERFELMHPLDLQVAVLRSQRSQMLWGATDGERSIIATIVSELGSNVLKYGIRGVLEVRLVPRGEGSEIEIVARDAGPGIADVARAFEDHVSTGRTLGLGLPGVKRMADEVDVSSDGQNGTTIRVRKRLRGAPNTTATAPAWGTQRSYDVAPPWHVHATLRPMKGEPSSGDEIVVVDGGATLLLGVLDATGHGGSAHEVAEALAAETRRRAHEDLPAILAHLHTVAAGTAGAAVGLARLDARRRRVEYLGLGNPRAARLGVKGHWRGVARDGVLGRRAPAPFVQSVRVEPGDVVALWTDGLPETLTRTLRDLVGGGDLAGTAGTLLRDHARLYDDAACLLAQWRG